MQKLRLYVELEADDKVKPRNIRLIPHESLDAFYIAAYPEGKVPLRFVKHQLHGGNKKIEPIETIYFLFGEDACRAYSNGGLRELRKDVEKCGISYGTYEYTGDVFELMQEYSGWNDYIILTKRQYQNIINL